MSAPYCLRISAYPIPFTVPALPSTVMICPLWIQRVADPVPITAGKPYSRATIKLWLSRPPISVTMADAIAKSGVHAGVVMPATIVKSSLYANKCETTK